VAYSQIKGIIFDLGSTLVEFESRSWEEITSDGQKLVYDHLTDSDHRLPDFETFNSRLEEIKDGYRVIARETLREWRSVDAFEKLLAEYELDNPREQGRRSADVFYSLVRDGFVLCEGAVETLREVKRRGYKTGLISNTIFPREAHETDLGNFGLLPYIDFRVYSSDFGFRKPHRSIYEEGTRLIGLPPQETLVVGDRYYEDVEGPQKIGMAAVLKYREGREYPDPMPPELPVINRLSELLDIVAA
jgi:FMN phosphatase YigB (HAD superfamily)